MISSPKSGSQRMSSSGIGSRLYLSPTGAAWIIQMIQQMQSHWMWKGEICLDAGILHFLSMRVDSFLKQSMNNPSIGLF